MSTRLIELEPTFTHNRLSALRPPLSALRSPLSALQMGLKDSNMLRGEPFDDDPADEAPRIASNYRPLHTFDLPYGADRQYAHQFADVYFLRLVQLKNAVKQKAAQAWDNFELRGKKPKFVDRVLDVRQGELCWMVGTVYMDMASKPNVLDDLSHEHWIAAAPAPDSYIDPDGKDKMMFEDESGRLRVTGEMLSAHYVTGCILAALGTEQADGVFQVIATQYADLPRQPQRWEREDVAHTKAKQPKPKREKAGKIALISGLDISDTSTDVRLDLLLEYLTGEAAGPTEQSKAATISRLLIAGNSFERASPILSRKDFDVMRSQKKQYAWELSDNLVPTQRLDSFLSQLLPTLPVTLIPGDTDPAGVALPQQPLHPVMFEQSRAFANPPLETNETLHGLDFVTNPWEGDIDGFRVLGTGGQTVKDLLRYVDGVDPIDAMEMMLRWRCIAPTAPDTLWCYPFQDDDPLLLRESPHVYFAGNAKAFQARTVVGPAGQRVLLVAVPRFSVSGDIVLVDMESLEAEVVHVGMGRRREMGKNGEGEGEMVG
ncbi:DNA polymeras-like protein subunit delta-2 [Massarina eburnea CBS 473.64]|uniref:DNA-directed DNA polymerase n=1 Tax=Massarina eburnea CBS 473.64 TaxID=1395130 RepID=A0A6A6SCQ1_9PLEO|nr:DNA polymeras-like protein subunit delta-2 [Massarina eburnea CBS 473.64]